MPYLIDSDWVIDHLESRPEAMELLERISEGSIAISIITYMEVFEGLQRSPDRQEAEAKFQSFLDGVPVVPFTLSIAQRCARLREHLRRQGRRVKSRALDLIIAATALEHDLTLVSRNLDDYSDIPDISIYRQP